MKPKKPKPPKITDFSKALLEQVHNSEIDRARLDVIEGQVAALCAHLGVHLKPAEPEPSNLVPFAAAGEALQAPEGTVAVPKVVIPEGADKEGHWHASCVHGYEWGHNCRCTPKEIEYLNAACPEFCEGEPRKITRGGVNVH